jgi:cardiolipin hydrolase
MKAFEEALRETLEDARLDRSERRSLRALFEDVEPDRRERQLLRAKIFEVAADAMPDEDSRRILEWTEKVIALLAAATDRDPPRAEARFSPGGAPRSRICSLLDEARQRADLCVFTITDNRITRSILRAHHRGVRLRVLTDDDKAHDLGSDIELLAEQGVEVAIDDSPAHMHHKFALFDRELLLTGSFNWTRSASAENHENVLVTGDPRFVRPFQAKFDSLWRRFTDD